MDDSKAEKIRCELQNIEEANGGLLKPEDVVGFARSHADSALHTEFEWDDTKAAAEHRLAQARQVIRYVVTVLPHTPQRVKAYVSVPTDRINGGGYRRSAAALKSDTMRRQLVEDVLKRVEALKTNAGLLPELEPLFLQIGVMIAQFRAAAHDRGP